MFSCKCTDCGKEAELREFIADADSYSEPEDIESYSSYFEITIKCPSCGAEEIETRRKDL